MSLNVQYLPALQNNLIWILTSTDSQLVQVVDPSISETVVQLLKKRGWILESIFVTHHHQDHCAGVPGLLAAFPKAQVLRYPLQDRSMVSLFAGTMLAQVFSIPGHTLDHTAFLIEGRLFCGDTLFGAGCGRLFEGTYEQLYQSLQILKQLPEETLVYCGHEYTLANLAFAVAAEPEAEVIKKRIADTQAQLAHTGCSLPSSIALERQTNPFFRCEEPTVRAAVLQQGFLKEDTPLGVFTGLRQWKDQF